MEQWVSKTFALGYDHEPQNTSVYFHQRTRNNRMHVLQHQSSAVRNLNTARRFNNREKLTVLTPAAMPKKSNATEMPIIVNNPNYVSPKVKSVRQYVSNAKPEPVSTRCDDVPNLEHGNCNAQVENNKVYKYFSNSAQYDRKCSSLSKFIDRDVNIERECFHISDKVCPHCDAPLRSYENCCLRCQQNLPLKLNAERRNTSNDVEINENHVFMEQSNKSDLDSAESSKASSFALVCVNCERIYALCPDCLMNRDVCRACHKERSVCMNCRSTLCSFCLDEIARGRDRERSHINDLIQPQEDVNLSWSVAKESENKSDCSFLIIKDSSKPDVHNASDCSKKTAMTEPNRGKTIQNNLRHPLKGTWNLNRSYVAGRNAKLNSKSDQSSDEKFAEVVERAQNRDQDEVLAYYSKNNTHIYKNLNTSNQSTQTLPLSIARRDVVLNEAGNLCMSLVNDMPKMTRPANQTQVNDSDLGWKNQELGESRFPKVFTAVGVISKQLKDAKLYSPLV